MPDLSLRRFLGYYSMFTDDKMRYGQFAIRRPNVSCQLNQRFDLPAG